MAMFDDAEEADDGQLESELRPADASTPSSSTPSTSDSELETLTERTKEGVPVTFAASGGDAISKEQYRKERKAFLSGRIGGPTPPPPPRRRKTIAPEDDEDQTRFRGMRYEVLNYGRTEWVGWGLGCVFGQFIVIWEAACDSEGSEALVARQLHVKLQPSVACPPTVALWCLWQVFCLASMPAASLD